MDDLSELLWGTRFEFDHPPTAEEALDVLLELHGLHELDVSVAEAVVTIARNELAELRATVAVPIEAGRAAWEWMNATGEHHGSDLMPLRTVLDSHPLIGGCRDCRHGSDEHEPARFGGCKDCACPYWVDPHPEEN